MGIGQGIAILGTAIATLLSPIGLTIAGLAALVGYFVYTSGAGTQAMQWLGERFNELKDTALGAWQGSAMHWLPATSPWLARFCGSR